MEQGYAEFRVAREGGYYLATENFCTVNIDAENPHHGEGLILKA
jgi:hypothetical protein